MQLQIFAKYYRSLDRITLPAGFIARVVSYEEQDKIFDTNSGTLVAFSFSLTFPIITFVFLVIYVGGLFSYVIKSNILKKDDHHPTQAALVCVGQSYTLYVVIMDVIAATKSEITPYLRGVIISLAAVEFVLFLVIIVFICILCDHQRFKKREKCFQYMYFPLFCTRVTKMDVRQWFVIVGLIPALVCLSSHIGFIIEGWVSSNSRGTAVMLLYSCLFVFLFIVFQSMYSVLTNIRNKKKNTGPQRVDSGNPTIQDPERRSLLQRNQQKGTEQQYLDFCSLAIELLPGIPILGGILAYIGYGVFHVPIIRGAEDVVTHVYNLGETASIFVVFLITYLIFLYKGEYRGPIRPFNPLQRRSSV